MYSPLEQFEIYGLSFIPNPFFLLEFFAGGVVGQGFILLINEYWKNLFLVSGCVSLFLFFFFLFFYSMLDIKNSRRTWVHFIDRELDNFIWTLLSSNILIAYFDYLFFIFSLFCLVLFSNLFGLIPYTYTTTSHIIFTFLLAFCAFGLINFIGIRKQGFHFFALFLPSGAPLAIAPFLIIIEIISYVARVFSLSIRLFANLMSGHTLLKILAGFIWLMLLSGSINFICFLIPAAIVFIVTGLELAIAFLQAYVFTILVIIYFNDVLSLH
jgi:F-type H+-transporting ATPase subunit a